MEIRILLDSNAYSGFMAHAMETGVDLISADTHTENIDGIAWIQVPVG